MWIDSQSGEIYGGDLRFGTADFVAPSAPPPGVTHAVLDEMGAFVGWADPPAPPPDWQALTDSIPVDVAIILDSHNSFLSKRLFRLESHPDLWGNANDKLFGYWNTPNPPTLTAEQRTGMNAALTASNIPAVVNSDNTLSYSA